MGWCRGMRPTMRLLMRKLDLEDVDNWMFCVALICGSWCTRASGEV